MNIYIPMRKNKRFLSKKPIKMKPFNFKGFKVEILKYQFDTFKFEYLITPFSASAKAIAQQRGIKRSIFDPSSYSSMKTSKNQAKQAVKSVIFTRFWD